MKKLTREMKEFAMQAGADLVGVGPVERWREAPDDKKPTYYMPDAKYVITFACKQMDGMCDVWGTYLETGKTIAPYLWDGYTIINWFLAIVNDRVARWIEHRGYTALPMPQHPLYRTPPGLLDLSPVMMSEFSFRHAAVACGLGELGFQGLLVTPQFGMRQRLTALITNAPLDPDPIYDGPPLCDVKRCGKLCIALCPIKAFSTRETVRAKIGNRVFEYLKLNKIKCIWAFRFCRATGVRVHFKMPDEINRKVIDDYTKRAAEEQPEAFIADESCRVPFANFCGICMHHCPAPNFEEKKIERARERIRISARIIKEAETEVSG